MRHRRWRLKTAISAITNATTEQIHALLTNLVHSGNKTMNGLKSVNALKPRTFFPLTIRQPNIDMYSAAQRSWMRHAIRPTVGYYKQKTCISRRDTVLLNRLRIGHARLAHSYLLSGDDLPSCPDVPLRNYTLTHSVALVDSLIVFSSVFSCTPLITLSILGFVASCCLRVSRVWQWCSCLYITERNIWSFWCAILHITFSEAPLDWTCSTAPKLCSMSRITANGFSQFDVLTVVAWTCPHLRCQHPDTPALILSVALYFVLLTLSLCLHPESPT